MTTLNQLLALFWIAFIAYWIVSAISSKKTIRNASWKRGMLIRILVIVVITLLFQNETFRELATRYDETPHEVLGILGVILCAAGLGFAVWARIHLGKNWGMPMSVKKDTELVTSGPYRLVRHPIYAGILLAALGSSLVDGLWWLVFFIFYIGYFLLYSMHVEEKNMADQFPDEYSTYKKQTKKLIPFIF